MFILPIETNLKRGIQLLNAISNEQYSNDSIPPYFSSIGSNIRHVLDVFQCVLDGVESRKIDFSIRERNIFAEQKVDVGLAYFNQIIQQLHQIKDTDLEKEVIIIDELGSGKVTVKSTFGSALAQAHSHTIHHYASIGFIINQLSIDLPVADFGYNPTTPKK